MEVKSVKVKARDLAKLQKSMRENHAKIDFINTMLDRTAERSAREANRYWDKIARLLGFEDNYDARDKGYCLHVCERTLTISAKPV